MQCHPFRSPLTAAGLPGLPDSRKAAGVLRFGAFALALSMSMPALPATGSADPLDGTVVGKDGQPKPYVRIDIIGPRRVVVVADDTGRFAVDVPQGRYKVRVTDNRRRMDFDATSPSQGQQFKLSW
jgi:hypothetical protein